eukprot:m.16934 g.16934  ORF g.16934 m.16934 type:complete len:120 (-) comp10628_c0_seq2:1145-1504(-)
MSTELDHVAPLHIINEQQTPESSTQTVESVIISEDGGDLRVVTIDATGNKSLEGSAAPTNSFGEEGTSSLLGASANMINSIVGAGIIAFVSLWPVASRSIEFVTKTWLCMPTACQALEL